MGTSSRVRISPRRSYELLTGVGGIGTGIFLALEGSHTLGRNESRPALLLDIRDYCKLHIVCHYFARLVGATPLGRPFRVLPVGKVGEDIQGRRLLDEMVQAGIDTRFVASVPHRPTLLSVCLQYPDGAGGNVTTSNSAAANVSKVDLEGLKPLLGKAGSKSIALAVPEVPLGFREDFLQLASSYGSLCAASFTSVEIAEARNSGLLSLVDFLSINEDEAAALVGEEFSPRDPGRFLELLAGSLAAVNPGMMVIMSAGAEGAYVFEGQWVHLPACPVEAIATGGAGDALMAGTLAFLAADVPLGDAARFGMALAGLSVTSPHTIHPDANLEKVVEFARTIGWALPETVFKAILSN